MKTKRLIVLILGLFLIIVIAAPVFAASYLTPSHTEFDSSFQGTALEDKFYKLNIVTQEEAEKYPFTWWRDTTYQNNLWAHSESQFPNQLITAYADADTRVLVWAGQNGGANVVAIVGPSGNTIIGTGGSRAAARIALHALNDTIPDFQVNLRGVILTEANKEVMWGGQEWIGTNVNRTVPVQIYSHANALEVYAVKQAVSTANIQHELYTYAPEVPYGPDGNLGVGSAFAYNPYQPDNGLVVPNRFINAETTITLGGVTMTLKPTAPENAGMAVYLPTKDVLILGELFGKYFPPYGAIAALTATNMPVTRWITVLDNMKKINANVLVPMHTLPITNPADVAKTLGDSKDALTSVRSAKDQRNDEPR